MARCTFCGQSIEPGTGKIYVRKDGRILHFDTMKCEKNLLKLGRRPVDIKWSKHYKKT